MDFGWLLHKFVGRWKEKLGRAIHTLVIVVCLMCLAWEMDKSTDKLTSIATGADINYAPIHNSVNLSLTICKVVDRYDAIEPIIRPLTVVQYKNTLDNNDDWITVHKEASDSVGESFLWFDGHLSHLCKSTQVLGLQTQVLHQYGANYVQESENMLVYLHETGAFLSSHKIPLGSKNLDMDNIFHITVDQLNQIYQPDICSPVPASQVEGCHFGQLADRVHNIAGCILKYMR